MTTTYLIDGIATDRFDSCDRGLHYGDGLFETLAVRDGHCEFWPQHIGRLTRDCERLGFPALEREMLEAERNQLCAGIERGVLKIILTRGCGGRGYRIQDNPQIRRILCLNPWPDHGLSSAAENGVRVRLCQLRLSRQPALAGIKHLNRLEQVLARREWTDDSFAEGLLFDTEDYLIEATSSNVFLVRDGKLSTPRLDQCGVAGVMRGLVMSLSAENGMVCSESSLSRQDLEQADEIFLTNSLIGIWPVMECDGRRYPVGAVTRRLQSSLDKSRAEDRLR